MMSSRSGLETHQNHGRVLKKIVQQGRSKRSGEAYASVR